MPPASRPLTVGRPRPIPASVFWTDLHFGSVELIRDVAEDRRRLYDLRASLGSLLTFLAALKNEGKGSPSRCRHKA